MSDPDIRHIIEPELAEGEELLWAGKPLKHPNPISAKITYNFLIIWLGLLVVFSVMLAIVLIVFWKDNQSGPLLPLAAMVVIPFMYFAVRPFLKHAQFQLYGIKNSLYALTDQRALIISQSENSAQLLSISPQDLFEYELQNKDQSIIFKPNEIHQNSLKDFLTIKIPPAFYCIADTKLVENLIRKHHILKE